MMETKMRPTPDVSLVAIHRLEYAGQHAVLIDSPQGSFLFDTSTSRSYRPEPADCTLFREAAAEKRAERLLASDYYAPMIASGQLFGNDSGRKRFVKVEKLLLQDVVLQIAYDCNLKCTYCYADEGSYGGKPRAMMSESVAKKCVDFAFEHRAGDTLGFAILGGEPLLNRDVMMFIIDYANSRAVAEGAIAEFLVTTNGIGLDERLLAELEGKNVAIRLSLDGTRDINDHYRLTKKKTGTFDMVNGRYGRALKKSGVPHQVRSSFFGEYSDRLQDQAQTLNEDLGYDSIKLDFIWGDDTTPGIVTAETLPNALNGIDHLSQWFFRRVLSGEMRWQNFNPYSKYMGRLVQPLAAANVYTPEHTGELIAGGSILENSGVECGAGINVVSISAEGKIYSCHRTEGNEDYLMGDIDTGINPESFAYWSSNWRLTNPQSDCSRCWARFTCMGGCPAFGVYTHKNPMLNDRVRCSLRRQFIANTVVLHHVMEESGISLGSACGDSCGGCSEQNASERTIPAVLMND
jgi:uncharacterized protein